MIHLYIEKKGGVGVKAGGHGVPGSWSESPTPGMQVAQKGEVGLTKATS